MVGYDTSQRNNCWWKEEWEIVIIIEKNIEKVLKEFNMDNSKFGNTPLVG